MTRILLTLLSLGLGALIGYIFYKLVGCRSGTCGITSNAWSSVIFGALLVWLALAPVVDKLAQRIASSKTEQGR